MLSVRGGLLHAAGNLGEERVVEVQHDQRDRRTADAAQLSRSVVPDEAKLVDRPLDALASWHSDHIRTIENVRDGANRHAGARGDIADRQSRHIAGQLTASG